MLNKQEIQVIAFSVILLGLAVFLLFSSHIFLQNIGLLILFIAFMSLIINVIEDTVIVTIIFLVTGVVLLFSNYITLKIIGWLTLILSSVSAITIIIKSLQAFLKAENGSEKDINFLIGRVFNNSLDSFYNYKLLTKFKSSKAINLFCQKWSQNRHKKLTKILLRAGYVATEPDDVRVLTALKIGKIKTCIDQNPKLVKWLLSAFDDQDFDIASLAKKYAITLTNQSAIDELFHLSVEENDKTGYIAYQCIQKAKYQSTSISNIKYKAFFHFLQDEWDAYDNLDFDQALLQQIYQSVSPELRKIIAEKARKRGWTEWLTVAQKSREKMNSEDWEITFSILKNNREFAKMWKLVRQSPVWVAQKLLVELSQSSYIPSPESNIFYQQLLILANRCPSINISNIKTRNQNQLLFYAEGYYRAISSDLKFLVTESEDNTKVWSIKSGQMLFLKNGRFELISSDSQFLVTSFDQERGPIKVWRIADGKLLFSAKGAYSPENFNQDEKFIITNEPGSEFHYTVYRIYRIRDGKCIFSEDIKTTDLQRIDLISPDCQFFVTCTDKYTREYQTQVKRIEDRQCLLSVKGYYQDMDIWSHNGLNMNKDHIITTDNYYGLRKNQRIKVWRIKDGRCLLSVEGISESVYVDKDWEFLVVKHENTTQVWRIEDGQCIFSIEGEPYRIGKDSEFLVVEHENTTQVWRIEDGQCIFSIDKRMTFYEIINSQLIVAKDENTIQVWRIENSQLLIFTEGYYTTVSPDWQFLVTHDSDDKNLKVWRIADGKLLFSAQEEYKYPGERRISPDWQFLVTSDSDNKNPKIWRIADGKLLFSAQGEYKEISPDWQFLVTSDNGNDNTKVWRLDLVTIQSYFLHKFTDKLTIQDMNFLQDLKKNPVSDYVYPIVTEEQKPWLDLIIKLAEYNLSFDVDITEDSPTLEMSEFDIEIED